MAPGERVAPPGEPPCKELATGLAPRQLSFLWLIRRKWAETFVPTPLYWYIQVYDLGSAIAAPYFASHSVRNRSRRGRDNAVLWCECVPACLRACVRVVILCTNNNVLLYLLLIVFLYGLLRKFLINLLNTFINIVALIHVHNLTVGVYHWHNPSGSSFVIEVSSHSLRPLASLPTNTSYIIYTV